MQRTEISGRTADPNILSTTASKAMRCAVALALFAACGASLGDEADATASQEARHPLVAALKPSGFFAQFGMADAVTARTVGVLWSLGQDSIPQPWHGY